MPSIRTLYNDELVEAHREAVAALRELLAQEKDPLERRKLANAILRARPVKDDLPPSPAQRERVAESARPGEGALMPPAPSGGQTEALRGRGGFLSSSAPASLNHAQLIDVPDDFDDDFDDFDDDFDDLDAPAHLEINQLAHQLRHGPDRLAALNRLQAIMHENMPLSHQTPAREETRDQAFIPRPSPDPF